MHGRRRRGFSLIELLTVIAIIAVVASLLLPVLRSAREKARAAVCWGNLRQIGLVASSYTQDFDEFAMPADLGGVIDSWINYANADLGGSVELFRCPSVAKADAFDPYGGNVWPYNQVKHASYVMNTIYRDSSAWSGAVLPWNPATCSGWGTSTTAPVRIAAVDAPSSKIYITDSLQGISQGDARGIVSFDQTDFGIIGVSRDVGVHHDGGFNALFGDGHVVSMLRSQAEQWAAVIR